jgi:hypothetical protein
MLLVSILCPREPGREKARRTILQRRNALEERCSGSPESGYAGSGLAAVEYGCTS